MENYILIPCIVIHLRVEKYPNNKNEVIIGSGVCQQIYVKFLSKCSGVCVTNSKSTNHRTLPLTDFISEISHSSHVFELTLHLKKTQDES